ncbi:MAG: hypothetical protein A3I05_02445 [Deltaproteobacteria bacterium RIFCSPLOWO2_02_FULL_44_10]|nr:MAG: hypothetical protein A3I05_02445 [Deltaproteobacteria bacterium RIFCSPLOWO2_02_FULL_44_10]
MLKNLEKEKIVNLIEESAFESMKSWKSCKRIILHENEHSLWIQSDVNSSFLNNILRFPFPHGDAGHFFRSLTDTNISLRCWVHQNVDAIPVISYLIKNNWKHKYDTVGMAIDLNSIHENIPINNKIVINEVKNLEMLRQWSLTFASIFNLPTIMEQAWYDIHVAMFHNAQPWRHYFVMLGEKSIAVASLFQHADVAYFAFGATSPEFRRQGIHSTLILRRLHDAQMSNCKIATLIAAPLSQAVCRRFGFQVYYKYHFYDWEAG